MHIVALFTLFITSLSPVCQQTEMLSKCSHAVYEGYYKGDVRVSTDGSATDSLSAPVTFRFTDSYISNERYSYVFRAIKDVTMFFIPLEHSEGATVNQQEFYFIFDWQEKLAYQLDSSGILLKISKLEIPNWELESKNQLFDDYTCSIWSGEYMETKLWVSKDINSYYLPGIKGGVVKLKTSKTVSELVRLTSADFDFSQYKFLFNHQIPSNLPVFLYPF